MSAISAKSARMYIVSGRKFKVPNKLKRVSVGGAYTLENISKCFDFLRIGRKHPQSRYSPLFLYAYFWLHFLFAVATLSPVRTIHDM